MKAVIFDMDGVLIDTEPLNDKHMIFLLKEMGVKVDNDYLRKLAGTHARHAWVQIIKDFNLKTPIDELIANSRESYLRYLASIKLKPSKGVVSFLKKLKKERYPLAVASSAYHKRIDILLDRCKLKEFFDVILSGDHVKKSKPDPEIYIKTAKLLRIKPKDCIVFEDATNGVMSAKAAGMKVIGYKGSEYNKQDLTGSDKIIDSFAGLNISIFNGI